MKKIIIICTLAVSFAACNNNRTPQTGAAGSAMQNTVGTQPYTTQPYGVQPLNQTYTTRTYVEPQTRVIYRDRPVVRRTTTTRYVSTNSAPARRRGWSKAAKGAVIGGAGGAVLGAVVSKNNRGSGALIGGVLGATGGYLFGRHKDKKDGRVH
jgi:hypothetical protein